MRIKAIALMAVLVVMCCGMQAHATGTHYPPGPGGACPDTLTISQIQNGPCRPPAVGSNVTNTDTSYVYGIKGIITGVKNNGSSRTFYMQSRRSDLSYTGMDVFNGNGLFNNNVQIGDSVSVSGKVEEGFVKGLTPPPGGVAESGETEISGFDNSNNTTADLPTQILSAGNSLPDFHTLSIADIRFPSINWNSTAPNASFATGEPWENCLVRVIGPLVVGKRAFNGGGAEATYPGIETRSPGGGGMLCYLQGSPGDSIYIDMTSFVTRTPPPVGTVLDSVRGILQQGGRAGSAGINSWRIAVRSSPPLYSNTSTPDLYVFAPPEVVDAYAVADDSVKVVFDIGVTNATTPSNYNLILSERTVDYVRMDGDNAVVCHIVEAAAGNSLQRVAAWPVGDPDSVTATGMTGAVNGLTQGSNLGRRFINGVLTIPMIQAPNPDSLAVCIDRSKYTGLGFTAGPRLSFRGVVTGKYFNREYYVQDEAGGPRSGILVFQPSAVLTVGRKYLFAGNVVEFFGETEVQTTTFAQDLGVGTTPPFYTSTVQTLRNFTCDGTQSTTNGEDYEGCLVNFSHDLRTLANAGVAAPGGFFHVMNVAGGPDSIEVDCIEAPGYNPNPNERITAQGPLSYRFSQGIVFPRNNGDVAFLGTAGTDNDLPRRVSFSSHPNPAQVTELTFALPRRESVELAVFDLFGRRLATLARGSFEPGTYSRKWDGRTDQGVRVGAGVHFYRLKVGQETYSLRGVLIH